MSQVLTQPRAWTPIERVLTGVGGLLIVMGVGDVVGSIAAGSGRDPGVDNFGQTAGTVLLGVLIGLLGGWVCRVSVAKRRARGGIVVTD